jgi:hypothetical protein
MTDIPLPAQSFEEAIPYLRRPYMPSQVRAKILTTPDPPAPCTIALYVIGEIQMDRFTLVCGSEWDHEFTKLTEEKTGSDKHTTWYCMVAATFTAFGITHTDIGEGTSSSRAGAEMNARAQASKRAGRKFGPGQCLYACDTIVMFRGEGPNDLRLPKGDDAKRYLKPYFDKEGKGQAHCREQYQQWLTRTGEKVYGPPLDHLAIAEAIRARPTTRPVVTVNSSQSQPPASAQATAPPNGASADSDHQDGAKVNGTQRPAKAKHYPPMPDHPAPEAALKAAQAAGFGEPAARMLSNLARNEGDDSKFTAAQLQAVANWIAMLDEVDVTEDVILKAIGVNARKNTSQERRQARFVKWLSEKASGETDESADDEPQPDTDAADEEADAEPETNGSVSPLDAARALAVLREAKQDYEYSDRTVTRLAALATGVGPKARVDWPNVVPATLLILAELLQSAGSLGWKNEQLDREVVKYHNSTEQTSIAGRFAAFANYLTDLAETRAMTQADTIEVG